METKNFTEKELTDLENDFKSLKDNLGGIIFSTYMSVRPARDALDVVVKPDDYYFEVVVKLLSQAAEIKSDMEKNKVDELIIVPLLTTESVNVFYNTYLIYTII